MRLVRFDDNRLGVLHEGAVFDVTSDANIDTAEWPPVGMTRVIAAFETLRPVFERAVRSGKGKPLASVALRCPLPWPSKLIAYPVAYQAHGAETGSGNRIDKNGFFLKCPSSLGGPQDAIVMPDVDREVHHECELGVVIGRKVRGISPAEALDAVFGYTCLIDVTVRGASERDMRKSYDTFTPIGPTLVTRDEVPDPDALEMKLWVGDELRQHANTRELILDVPRMIALAASVSTLYPGDLIATGTPSGVGPVKHGDKVTIDIERVGRMTVPVVQGEGGSNIVIRKGQTK
jgi:2-keto-4-pentenoate hydratase/2-oxohepta-3-ene-1,7-dioic acid hydratase in catechol pathway